MSWQVEQLKEELSSKEAQGEELKKRAAGLQAEVFAVRFTLLCAVIPQWDPASSGFWVAYTFISYGWQLCPVLALTSLLCSLTYSCSAVWTICHLCAVSSHVFWKPYTWFFIVPVDTVWMVLQSLFILNSFPVTRDLLVYINDSLFFFLDIYSCSRSIT